MFIVNKILGCWGACGKGQQWQLSLALLQQAQEPCFVGRFLDWWDVHGFVAWRQYFVFVFAQDSQLEASIVSFSAAIAACEAAGSSRLGPGRGMAPEKVKVYTTICCWRSNTWIILYVLIVDGHLFPTFGDVTFMPWQEHNGPKPWRCLRS